MKTRVTRAHNRCLAALEINFRVQSSVSLSRAQIARHQRGRSDTTKGIIGCTLPRHTVSGALFASAQPDLYPGPLPCHDAALSCVAGAN